MKTRTDGRIQFGPPTYSAAPSTRRRGNSVGAGKVDLQGRLDLGLTPESPRSDSDPVVDLTEIAADIERSEPRGVVYTRPWVVDLILDLADYRPENDLAARYVVEPSAGNGAFLVPMAHRLLESIDRHLRPLSDIRSAIHAYELDKDAAAIAISLVVDEMTKSGVNPADAKEIAEGWVTVGDFLLGSQKDRKADLVVGNPPYIRYDDLPEYAFATYNRLYPTMVGRCDIYVGFIEAGLRHLTPGGALAFICADRWMRAAYGKELRRLVSGQYGIEAVIEMHEAPAFENEVAAYPAVIVIRRAPQGEAIVASAGKLADSSPEGVRLADVIRDLAAKRIDHVPGFEATYVDRWFSGTAPWPSLEPQRLEVLQWLEERFQPLEDAATGTKVGIGVATGADGVYITKDAEAVEPERLLPLAMAADTKTGKVRWSGHYLVDPWEPGQGLADLATYPRMRAYFERHQGDLAKRHVAKRKAEDWYRTIDRVHHQLMSRHKLYFPDMKLVSNPTLDRGETYPHHNLYYLVSDAWDLEVLGGLLLSRVAQLFIEAYCVKMRGGTLRFQAQYLRRIRVPEADSLSADVCERLQQAFRSRDVDEATAASIEAYGIEDLAGAFAC
jgi:adenine-specific DNA-methyltransferase